GGERLAQLCRLGIGIKPQAVGRGGSHRFQRERRRAERAFIGVELHQIGNARLLAGHIGRKLTRGLAPERVHPGVGLEPPARRASMSISTSAPRARPVTPMQVRAGSLLGAKYLRYTVFIAA